MCQGCFLFQISPEITGLKYVVNIILLADSYGEFQRALDLTPAAKIGLQINTKDICQTDGGEIEI